MGKRRGPSRSRALTLYHYTYEAAWRLIDAQGVIRPSLSDFTPRAMHLRSTLVGETTPGAMVAMSERLAAKGEPCYVFLTRSAGVVREAYEAPDNVRITVRLRRVEVQRWADAFNEAVGVNVKPRMDQLTLKPGQHWRDWFVIGRPVPRAEWVAVDHVETRTPVRR